MEDAINQDANAGQQGNESQQLDNGLGQAGGDGGKPDSEFVPKARFDEVNNRLQSLQEKVSLMEQNSAIAAANAPAGNATYDIFADAGIEVTDPNEPLSAEDNRKVVAAMTRRMEAQIADMTWTVQHPDFTEMVGTPEDIKAGRFAAPLASAIKDNPALLPSILGSPNPKAVAYAIAKTAAAKLAAAKTENDKDKDDPSKIVDEAVANANRVKSSATTKGGGALSEEGRYANMTNEAFLELARSHGANL